MSDYIVTGKKGNGKSLVVVGKIRDALIAGRRVATNLDLKLEHLLPLNVRQVDVIRLPDYPSVEDMEAIGMGSDQLDEAKYGLIALDEMAVWMNSRQFGDKQRMPLLNWFVHSRKKRWDCFFICQNIAQLDKQFRESLADHHVICKRLDKMRIPLVGVITKNLFGVELRPPKVHHATVKFGLDIHALKVDSWTYRGISLYSGYDTEQVFDPNYENGPFCYLSPWHLKGRFENKCYTLRDWLRWLFVHSPRGRAPEKQKTAVIAHIAANPRLTKDQAWKLARDMLNAASQYPRTASSRSPDSLANFSG